MGRRRNKVKSKNVASGNNTTERDLERTTKLLKIIQQIPLENGKLPVLVVKRLVHEILNMNLIVSSTKERLPAQVTNNEDEKLDHTVIEVDYIYLIESWDIKVCYLVHKTESGYSITILFSNLTTRPEDHGGVCVTIRNNNIDDLYGKTPEHFERNVELYKRIQKLIAESLKGKRHHNLAPFPEWLDLRQ